MDLFDFNVKLRSFIESKFTDSVRIYVYGD